MLSDRTLLISIFINVHYMIIDQMFYSSTIRCSAHVTVFCLVSSFALLQVTNSGVGWGKGGVGRGRGSTWAGVAYLAQIGADWQNRGKSGTF